MPAGSYDFLAYDPKGENEIQAGDVLNLGDYNSLFDSAHKPKYYQHVFFKSSDSGFVAGSHVGPVVVARFDLATMRNVDFVDLSAHGWLSAAKGFGGFAAVVGNWAYLTALRGTPGAIRLRTDVFDFASSEAILWNARFPNARVDKIVFTHGGYIYMQGFNCGHPFATTDPRAANEPVWKQGAQGYDGCAGGKYRASGTYAYVVRVPESDFSADAVETLDLTFPDRCDEGVCGMQVSGFTDGVHGYTIPSYGAYDNKRMRHVLRFRLATFSEPEFLDFNSILPSGQTFGYGGGFAVGGHTYYYVSDGKHVVKMDAGGVKTMHLSGQNLEKGDFCIRGTHIGSTAIQLCDPMGGDRIKLRKFDVPSFNNTMVTAWKQPSSLTLPSRATDWRTNSIFQHGSSVYAASNSGHVYRFRITHMS